MCFLISYFQQIGDEKATRKYMCEKRYAAAGSTGIILSVEEKYLISIKI